VISVPGSQGKLVRPAVPVTPDAQSSPAVQDTQAVRSQTEESEYQDWIKTTELRNVQAKADATLSDIINNVDAYGTTREDWQAEQSASGIVHYSAEGLTPEDYDPVVDDYGSIIELGFTHKEAREYLGPRLAAVGFTDREIHEYFTKCADPGLRRSWIYGDQGSYAGLKMRGKRPDELQPEEAAAESKLRERAPDAYKDMVESLTDNSDVKELHIDGEQFQQAMDKAGVTFEQLQATMPDVARGLGEALATRGDVTIPVADYLTHVAGTPMEGEVLPHIKVDPEGMTYAEGQAFYQTQNEAMLKAAEKLSAAKEKDAEYQKQVKEVQDSITRQLTDAGVYAPSVSKEYAKLPLAFFQTTAHRLGMSPLEFYQRWGAKIVGDHLDRVTGGDGFGQPMNPGVDPAERIPVVNLDDVIPGIKKFTQEGADKFVELWKGAELTLSDGGYSARLSSIDPDHPYWSANDAGRINETRRAALTVLDRVLAGARRIEDAPGKHEGVGATIRFYVPVRRYNDNPATLRIVTHVLEGNKAEIDGVEIYDVMRERPSRRGRVASETSRASDIPQRISEASHPSSDHPDTITIREMLSGVKDAQGKPYFEQSAKPFDGREVAATPMSAGQAHIEVDGVTRSALNSEGKPLHWSEEGTRNFWRWFGDSKVVDEEGRPLVVYHGTNDAGFDTFSRERLGWNTEGNASDNEMLATSAVGFWANTGKEVSERGGYDATMPLYLRIEEPYNAGNLESLGRDISQRTPVEALDADGDPAGEMNGLESGKKYASYLRGLEYDGVIIQDEEFGGTSVVALNRSQIKSAIGNTGAFDGTNPNILRQQGAAPRGTFNPASNTITLLKHPDALKGADLSTFTHELGHHFFDAYTKIAALEDAPPEIKADVETLFKHLGVESLDQWHSMSVEEQRPYHEQLAKDFEKYMTDGKAPTPELQGAFSAFSSWLREIYRTVKELRCSPHARGDPFSECMMYFFLLRRMPRQRPGARQWPDGLRQALQAPGKWFMMPGRVRHGMQKMPSFQQLLSAGGS